jgi:two-component system chemotaxis response regulator CheY
MVVRAADLARPIRMMIVDDSNVIRRRIERCQRIDGLEVVGAASNGVDALAMFVDLDPDVVTMDITMPHMDGIECVERMVNLKPGVLILVISALADKATAVEAMEKGANGFLNKPFNDRQLNDALLELLGGA